MDKILKLEKSIKVKKATIARLKLMAERTHSVFAFDSLAELVSSYVDLEREVKIEQDTLYALSYKRKKNAKGRSFFVY